MSDGANNFYLLHFYQKKCKIFTVISESPLQFYFLQFYFWTPLYLNSL